ncbi:hypothetical protein [Planctomycetes bacterium Poly30]|uniref:hypothetical protein n=1 Tax=Saltatorellus ferox TaxID=2528018 RepID=UPI0011A416BD
MPLRGFVIVVAALVAVKVREHTGLLGYTVPELERPAVFAVWLPLVLAFLLANGLALVRGVPGMGLLPALVTKTRRGSAMLSLVTAILGAGVAALHGIGPLAGAAVAVFAYGLGAASHSRRTGNPRPVWFLAALMVAINGGRLMGVVDAYPRLAILFGGVGIVDQFLALRIPRRKAGHSPSRVTSGGGVTPAVAQPLLSAHRTPWSRLQASKGYRWRCRGPRFHGRVVLIVACALGSMTLMSSGMLWVAHGAEMPEGSFLASVSESIWGRPETADKDFRYGTVVMNLYFPLAMFPMWGLSQGHLEGYQPFSRHVLGRAAFHRYLKGGLLAAGLVTSFGLVVAVTALAGSGAPLPTHLPGFLLVLPYVLVAFPWVGMVALKGGDQLPARTTSYWRDSRKQRALLWVSLATGFAAVVPMMGSKNELSPEGGWAHSPWAWGIGLVVLVVGVWKLRRSFDRFYAQIPLVPEA